MLIDLHHHGELRSDAINNIRIGTDSIPVGDYLLSVGIHPWDTVGIIGNLHASLAEAATDPRVIAIGETGLDSLRGASLAEQQDIFTEHICLSERLQKPLIIHSVHTIHIILHLHRKIRHKMPWAIHGFRGKAEVMAQLHAAGIYTSLGSVHPAWLKEQLPDNIMPDLILAETDTSYSLPETPFNTAENLRKFVSTPGNSGIMLP